MDVLQKQFFGLDFESLALHDGTADYADDVVSAPHQALALPYAALVDTLRQRLDVPVYAFRYDWRKSCVDAGAQLLVFLDALSRKPMHSIPDWDHRFNIVCHSFGGLVFRAFMAAANGCVQDMINRVAMIAVPHYGSIDAVDALVRGQAPIFGGRKELRKLTRTFPSAYELLPTFPRAFVNADDRELDVFDISNWQRNVVQDANQTKTWAVEQHRLTAASSALRSIAPVLSDETLTADQCLSIIGLESGSTSVSVRVKIDGPVENWFDFENVGRGIGDGVVPVTSAHMPGVDYVWLSNDNAPLFSLARLVSLHAFLPCFDEVHTIVARFFEGLNGQSLLPLGMTPGNYVVARLP